MSLARPLHPRPPFVGILFATCMVATIGKSGLLANDETVEVRSPPTDSLPSELSPIPPYGLDEPTTSSNGDDDAAAQLGRRLFFDPILSIERNLACSSCHDPAHGFSDPSPRSAGSFGRQTERHAPTLYNRAFGETFMWDGRFATLEEQVIQPIQNELEMALPLSDAISRLRDDATYADQFHQTFEAPPSEASLARALAAFVRRLYHGDSAVDRFHGGEFDALSDQERAGMWVFEGRGACWKCHSGGNFTDEEFHNTGVGVIDGIPDRARAAVTEADADHGRFKTPTLRGVDETAPFMHDGSLATLKDVVTFYRNGGIPNQHLDERIQPIDMTDRDVDNLVAFLRALSRRATSPRKPIDQK